MGAPPLLAGSRLMASHGKSSSKRFDILQPCLPQMRSRKELDRLPWSDPSSRSVGRDVVALGNASITPSWPVCRATGRLTEDELRHESCCRCIVVAIHEQAHHLASEKESDRKPTRLCRWQTFLDLFSAGRWWRDFQLDVWRQSRKSTQSGK